MTKFHVGDRVRWEPSRIVGYVRRVYKGASYPYDVEFDGRRGVCAAKEEWLRPADISPQESDSVNHPAHYTAYKGVEVIDFAEQLNFNRGNVVKYVARAGLKNPDTEIEDLEKAAWYIRREIARLKGGDE